MNHIPAPEVPADHPAGPILERLHRLYPKLIDLSLGRIERLLAALGNPERRLPPTLHVAGTNGKGSTCAFLRAIGEAAGLRVHVTTSPHLVRVNERFRIAGKLVSDTELTQALLEIERINDGAPITVFEVLIAAGYLLFSRHPADLCIVEVGLGGRFDATNVIAQPAACAITSISLDHEEFLGDTLAKIAWEKAGILKPGCPAVTGRQPPEVLAVLRDCAREAGALLRELGREWEVESGPDGLRYADERGALALPAPALRGPHQIENAGLAIAAIRSAGLALPDRAFGGIAHAEWPARLQRLHGKLAGLLPREAELWLDGGHNEGAGQALAAVLEAWADRPLYLVFGMKQGKHAHAFLAPLLNRPSAAWAVAEPGQHGAMAVDALLEAANGRARPGPHLKDALFQIAAMPPGRVLICGSLYLAGEALKADQP